MTTPKEIVWAVAATFWRGVRNILYATLVIGGLVGLVWAYVAMCRTWPTVGWTVTIILVVLIAGATWND